MKRREGKERRRNTEKERSIREWDASEGNGREERRREVSTEGSQEEEEEGKIDQGRHERKGW